jgi:hypothetical protein
LHSRAKSAMAEILVSDLRDLSPAAAHRRVFRCREQRGPPVHWIVSACFSRLFFPVFLPVLYCFVSITFSLTITASYIVFLQIFPL